MYIHFFANLSRYFFNKQLARYFPRFRFPKAVLLDETQFYHDTFSFPFAYRKNQKIHIYLPQHLKDSIHEIAIRQKNEDLFIHQWSKNKVIDFVIDRKIYPDLQISGKAKDKIILFRERLVPLPGTCNFRDIGGYYSTNKKSIKWGKVYRSDFLGKLNFNSWAILKELGIKTVIDFRGREERLKNIDKLPANINYIPIPIKQGEQEDMIKSALLRGEGNRLDGHQIMKDIYIFLVDAAFEQYRIFFQILKDENNYPVVFHCTAGKDRTGYAAALLQHFLEVDDQTIMHDYLLSNLYRHLENHILLEKGKFFLRKDILADFLKVKSEYLNITFNHIKENFQSVNRYAEAQLNVTTDDRKKLQKLLLE